MKIIAMKYTWESGHKNRMSNLLSTKFLSDVTLIVGPQGNCVEAHRLILRAGSPKLNDLLQDDTKPELVIEDVDPSVFKIFLQHLYTGESQVAEFEMALHLLKLASDFQVTELILECEEILIVQINIDNVIDIFKQAKGCCRTGLVDISLQFICKDAQVIVESEKFLEMKHEHLMDILGRDDFMVTSETQLFESLVKWGEAECVRQHLDGSDPHDLRTVLDKLLGLVRFPLMEFEEFTLKVALKNLLKAEELILILLYFNVSEVNRSCIPAGRFNSAKRCKKEE